jgi:hypothetical protein
MSAIEPPGRPRANQPGSRAVSARVRGVNRRARRWVARCPVLLVPVLVVLLAGGCGGDKGNSSAQLQADLRLKDEAGAKANQAADKIVKATPDRNVPSRKYYKAACLRRGEAGAGDIPPNMIKCHIEAFFRPFRGHLGGYLWSEDWLVPLQGDKLGTPVIGGDYRIRNFLREDNKRNCIGRQRPGECLPQSVGGQLPG